MRAESRGFAGRNAIKSSGNSKSNSSTRMVSVHSSKKGGAQAPPIRFLITTAYKSAATRMEMIESGSRTG
ncbi:MAG: hypothetical protein KDJ66_06700, partial [Nitratireductor sp.]|nr:hypothetical protein [Nitratireductor sp.]